MPITWNAYVKRRRIANIPAWFFKKGVSSYSQLIKTLDVNDIIPPTEQEVSCYWAEVDALQTATTKSSSKNNSKSGMTVDEEGFLVAEQAKKEKPVRRKRSTRASKKSSTKSG